MNDLWYKRMGFEINPFSIKPIHFNDKLIDKNTPKILDKIALGKIVYINGEYGTGKTSILKSIINKFGGKKQVAYYNCNTTEDSINTKRILKQRYNWFLRILGFKGKNMILLLDEIQDLSEEDSRKLIEHHEKGAFKSIILVGKKKDINFTEQIKEIIEDNQFETEKITLEQATELIRNRIGEIPILPDETIKEIYKKSNKNPRKFLENCEDVCFYATENNIEIANKKTVQEAIK